MKQERISKTLDIMKSSDLDMVIYAPSANFQYLLESDDFYFQRACDTNIMGRATSYNLPEVLLLLDSAGNLNIITNRHHAAYFMEKYHEHTTCSYMDQFEDAMAPFIKGKRIAVGFTCFEHIKTLLKAIDEDIEVVDGEDLLKDIRCFKDEDEIAKIRRVSRFTDEACMYVVKNLKRGMSMREAENLLVKYGYENGADDLSFPPTVGFKTRNTITTSEVGYYDREWKLQDNTSVAFDVGLMIDGYCSDWGRTIFFGKASENAKKGYKALNEAILYMVDHIIPYKTNINELYRMVKDKVEELGMADYLRYKDIEMLGHQIGIDCHEFPLVNKDNDFIIKPGMTFAVEPKMWFDNDMYMRVEDIILITETGAEILTEFPRDLFEIELD